MLSEKYGVSIKTIDRWAAAGILPLPLVLNNRRYWDEGEVEQRERERLLSPANHTRHSKAPQSTEAVS